MKPGANSIKAVLALGVALTLGAWLPGSAWAQQAVAKQDKSAVHPTVSTEIVAQREEAMPQVVVAASKPSEAMATVVVIANKQGGGAIDLWMVAVGCILLGVRRYRLARSRQ